MNKKIYENTEVIIKNKEEVRRELIKLQRSFTINSDIYKYYSRINELIFDGKLRSDIELSFSYDIKPLGLWTLYTNEVPTRRTLELNKRHLEMYPETALNILIHEMLHEAAPNARGHKGEWLEYAERVNELKIQDLKIEAKAPDYRELTGERYHYGEFSHTCKKCDKIILYTKYETSVKCRACNETAEMNIAYNNVLSERKNESPDELRDLLIKKIKKEEVNESKANNNFITKGYEDKAIELVKLATEKSIEELSNNKIAEILSSFINTEIEYAVENVSDIVKDMNTTTTKRTKELREETATLLRELKSINVKLSGNLSNIGKSADIELKRIYEIIDSVGLNLGTYQMLSRDL